MDNFYGDGDGDDDDDDDNDNVLLNSKFSQLR
jgi:hypothetical protein